MSAGKNSFAHRTRHLHTHADILYFPWNDQDIVLYYVWCIDIEPTLPHGERTPGAYWRWMIAQNIKFQFPMMVGSTDLPEND
jgi:hypothetical protein